MNKSYDELHPKKIKKVKVKVNEKTLIILTDNNIQLCPGCLHPIEKIGGCNYVKCVICKTRWCWVCHKVKGYKENMCNEKEHNSH